MHTDPGSGDCPACDLAPPSLRWHRVTVETTGPEPGARPMRQSAEGGDAVTAAWLRAYADQIDPPKPVRPVMRDDARPRGPIIQERRVPGAVAALPQPGDVPVRGGGWARGPFDPLSGQ
jgi:hypothetical protein